MVIDWQDTAAVLMVAVAAAWLARGAWRRLRRRGAAGCPSCSGCAAERGETATPELLEIQPPEKS
jgi:hypothetical protein